jgi:predicted kinase
MTNQFEKGAKRRVVIMQGVSGSGKSTYVAAEFPEATVVSANDYFMHDGEYRFDGSLLQKSHEFCWRQFLAALQRGDSLIVVDNTNTTAIEISPYMLPAESFGYSVEIITLDVQPYEAADQNIHGVPHRTVYAQNNRIRMFLRYLPRRWRQRTIVL